MVASPGANLDRDDDRCLNCHRGQRHRVTQSIMNTRNGITRKTNQVFQKSIHPPITPPIHPSEDARLYQERLCDSCHISSSQRPEKERGCLSCHLEKDVGSGPDQKQHRIISRSPPTENCSTCHSGSGRIALTYSGRRESFVASMGSRGILESENRTTPMEPDVHFTAGLTCVDCHNSSEVMGDGSSPSHKGEGTLASCNNCHRKKSILTQDSQPDQGSPHKGLEGTEILSRTDGKRLISPDYRETDHDSNHDTLSCDACHNQGTPFCVGCHIQKEYEGDTLLFREYRGEANFRIPVLGHDRNRIRPFLPGMKLTLGFKPDKPAPGLYRNLFAPLSPHSIGRKARRCEECHWNPATPGYGEGKFELSVGNSTIRFYPDYQVEAFGPFGELPQDGWIRPMDQQQSVMGHLTLTQETAPLSPLEQKRLLQVGVCLRCHEAPGFYTRFSDQLSGMPVDLKHKNLTNFRIDTVQKKAPPPSKQK